MNSPSFSISPFLHFSIFLTSLYLSMLRGLEPRRSFGFGTSVGLELQSVGLKYKLPHVYQDHLGETVWWLRLDLISFQCCEALVLYASISV